ncbi:MAG: DUF1579 domain-containing protein [Anaerolineae bacterium]|nr:DUF1579 domain-containing protein [Anaerolineae bacterium]
MQVHEQRQDTIQDGRADFDFFFGTWKVHNRRLKARLKGSTDWEEFYGECTARPILGGLANFDESVFHRESGILHGATLRVFNPTSRQWSLYWVDDASHTLQIPMIGGFKDGRGEFYSQEPFEGRHIFCRFIWSNISPTTCRWEQAFSEDGGKTWETNWVMDNTRIR